jgi:hypothetical protein
MTEKMLRGLNEKMSTETAAGVDQSGWEMLAWPGVMDLDLAGGLPKFGTPADRLSHRT